MISHSKKAHDCLLRARQKGFPEPTVHITPYGHEVALCGVCERHFQLGGYNRHFEKTHMGVTAVETKPRIKRYPDRRRKTHEPTPDFADELIPVGEWRWRKMSQESIQRILANYPKQTASVTLRSVR